MEAFLLRGLFLMCCILLVQSLAMMRSCKEYRDAGFNSGTFRLDLHDGLLPFLVYCDMDVEGGGWTVFQRRIDGAVDFFRDWQDYKQGFGNFQREFWLGNDHLHRLTKAGHTILRVDMQDWEGKKAYAKYAGFTVGAAPSYYRLTVWDYKGTAGDSLTFQHGMLFSTKDADRDRWHGVNCAEAYIGAWWYDKCSASNLNGKYHVGGTAYPEHGIMWKSWKGYEYSLKYVEMKVREP